MNGVYHCPALVDSGNVYRTAMSESFARKMGFAIEPAGLTTLGTAKKGADLEIVGQSAKSLTLQFPGLATHFKVKPVILKNLQMPFNISGCFLKGHNIDQIHTRNALRVCGKLIKLTTTPAKAAPQRAEISSAHARVARRVLVPANSAMHVPLVVDDVEKGRMAAGGALLQGGERFMNATDLHPWLSAVVNVDEKGNADAEVANTTGEDILIEAGQVYGTVTKLKEEGEKEEDFPWRLSAMTVARTADEVAAEILSSMGGKKNKQSDQQLKTVDDRQLPSVPEGEDWTREKKIEFLRKEFRLSECDALKTSEQRQEALDLLLEFWDTISVKGEFGRTSLIEHEIPTGETRPIKCRTRPINPALEADLKVQVAKWLECGIIEPANSAWNSPLVAVPKKSGSLRWCVDFRRVNSAVRNPDAFPMPNCADNLSRMADSKIFSTLDGAGAFHVIPIKESDRPKTAFSTPGSQYQFRYLPFGLGGGPATYCRLVEKLVEGLPLKHCLAYLDDTLVHAQDLNTHNKVLRKLLFAYRRAGLKLQPAKCMLWRSEVEYLGHRVSSEGIGVIPRYVEIVRDWPLPKTRKEVRLFLGKTGYYRRFIKDYAHSLVIAA